MKAVELPNVPAGRLAVMGRVKAMPRHAITQLLRPTVPENANIPQAHHA